MLYTFVLLGTELGGDLSILQECILCGHDCSYPMRLAGLCYQASEICQAEGSQGRVRNMVNGSYIEELQSSSDDYDKLVFQFTLCESIRFSKRILWVLQLPTLWSSIVIDRSSKTCCFRLGYLPFVCLPHATHDFDPKAVC
jgi:hypothetical protein